MLRSRITVGIIHGLLLSLYLLVIYIPDIKATLGDACDNCNGTNETCRNETGICVCEEGFYDSNGTASGGTCNPKFDLGPTCTAVEGEQVCKDSNATCIGSKCTCGSNFYDDNGATSGGTCKLKFDLGPTCTAVEGEQVCKDSNATCIGNKCTCGSNFYDDNGATSGGTCKLKFDLGPTCTAVEGEQVCKDSNATCIGNKCTCGSNFYDDNGATSGGTCKLKFDLGPTCTAVEGEQVCKDSNATCIGSKCTCGSNFYDDNGATSGGTCKLKFDLGPTCTAVEGEQVCKDSNATCIGNKCTCGSNFYDDNGATSGGTCKLKFDLGPTCTAVEGEQVCKDSNATCIGNKCTCGSNFYDDNGATSGGTCKLKFDLGPTCTAVEGEQVCKDSNATCIGNKCTCGSNFYDDNGATSGGTCKLKFDLGPTCTAVEGEQVCKDSNATCIGNKCTCGSNFYDDNGATSGGTCKLKFDLGPTCTAVEGEQVCKDSNATCIGNKCTCGSNFYDDNGATSGGTCKLKFDLGPTCTAVEGEQVCKDSNATCIGNKCTCGSNFYDDNGATSGGTCKLKFDLGPTCTAVEGEQVCKDSNATCIGNKCTCGSNFYDDNGATSGGTCKLITNLRVTSLVYGIITENMIPISWTPPSDRAAVSFYRVTYWQADTTTVVNQQNVGNQTSFDLNNLDPGKKYSISIFSVNTQTDLTERSTSLTQNQTTKPGVPGALLKDMDIDASSGSITLQWNSSSGVVTGYGGSLENTTLFKYSRTFNTSGITPNQTFSDLKSGTWYNFTVQAVVGYADTKTLYSEIHSQLIKTKVQVPNPPTNLSCFNATDRAISLKWIQPLLPNGDIISYFIVIQQTQPRQEQFNVTSQGTNVQYTVNGLTAGSFYTFQVYTRNELYTSTSFAQKTSCETEAQNSSQYLNQLNRPEQLATFCFPQTTITLKSLPDTSNFMECPASLIDIFPFEDSKKVVDLKVKVTDLTEAEPPEDLLIMNVTSRSGGVTWNKPNNLNGTLYGYSLQILNDSSCIRVVIWRCNDCQGAFPNLTTTTCLGVYQQTASSTALLGPQYYAAMALFPDTNYTVTVAAITGIGIGNTASNYLPTKEEAPSKPSIVLVRNITDKTATVEWNMDEVRPGQTNYIINATGISPAEMRTHSVSGFFNRKYEFIDLEEYRNYSVTVQANTSIGSNQSDSYNFTTSAGPAGPVERLYVNQGLGDDMYVKARVSWMLPDELNRNGPINSFYVQQRQNDSNGTSFEVNKTTIKRENDATFTYYVTFDVLPEANYTFMVRADTGSLTGKETVKNYTAPAGPPVNIENPGYSVVPADKASVYSKTSFRVEVDRNFFKDSKNGAIKAQGLICCKDPICINDNSTVKTYDDIKNMKTYAQAKQNGSIKYRLPNENTTREQVSGRRKRAYNPYVYDVGIESCDGLPTEKYCNGPLDPGSTYRIIAFVCTSAWCTLSKSYGPFITLSVISEPVFPVGAVVGGIIGGLAALAFIIVLIVLLRYRSNRGKRARRALDDGNDPSHMENLVKIKKQRPIRLTNFAEYVADYHKDSNLKFSEEYDDLKALSPQHSHEAADMEENRLKNRFVNILPFDHSRVRLLPIDDVPGSDYINANYLPGFSKTREYIACQGPIPATIDDHWRLVWEQNVRVIVMLTQYKEENRVKCEPYMPLDLKDPKQYGDLVVECMTYSSMNSFEYRTLKIRLGEKERTIKHFHFLSWRDYSANVQLDTMIDFIKKVRSFMQPPDVEGPMIVHCSAGVGRTGTYITIDHAIQHIDKYGPDSTLDIFNFVLKMRENRTTMVQTEQQYIFIHDCIKEYLDRFKTYENQAFNPEEENLYQNTAETMDLYQNVSFNSTQKTEL